MRGSDVRVVFICKARMPVHACCHETHGRRIDLMGSIAILPRA